MTTQKTNPQADFDAAVQRLLQDSPDPGRERSRMLHTVLGTPDNPTHPLLDPEGVLEEALLQVSGQAHFDLGLYKTEVSLELTTLEALITAPSLTQALAQALADDIPEELEDRVLEETSLRAQQVLDLLPSEERLALTQAFQNRLSVDQGAPTTA